MIKREGDWMVVRGRMTIETIPAIFTLGLQHLASENMKVDLSHVEAVDSAAVSLLLGWARAARRFGHELRVTGLPEDLKSLAQLYGVIEMLPEQPNEPFGSAEPPEQPIAS